MSLNQVNEQFNDAIETYFPPAGPRVWPRRAGGVALVGGLRLWRRLCGGRLQVNERIVEYPLVLRWLRTGGTVLDVGCSSSRLPLQLASLGYTTHGLDVRPYPLTHPNFHFHRADLFAWSPPTRFDTILLVSTLEHFGLGGYRDATLPDADQRAVARLAGWLAPGGQLLVSVPFGQAGQTPRYRVYDEAQLRALFATFDWQQEAYFQRVEGAWLPSSAAALRDVPSLTLPVNGVAVLDLRKL